MYVWLVFFYVLKLAPVPAYYSPLDKSLYLPLLSTNLFWKIYYTWLPGSGQKDQPESSQKIPSLESMRTLALDKSIIPQKACQIGGLPIF